MQHKVNIGIEPKELRKIIRMGKIAVYSLTILDYLTLKLMHGRILVQIEIVAELIAEAVADSIEITYEDK